MINKTYLKKISADNGFSFEEASQNRLYVLRKGAHVITVQHNGIIVYTEQVQRVRYPKDEQELEDILQELFKKVEEDNV